MKKLFYWVLAVAFLPLVFTSCGDDDDEGNVDNAGTATVFPADSKLVAKIAHSSETSTFTYANGKLMKINMGNYETVTFEYSGSTVKITDREAYSSSNAETSVYTFKLNSKGYVSGGSMEYKDGDETESGTVSLSYNGDYLTGISTNGSHGSKSVYQITWKDGNVTQVKDSGVDEGEPYSYSYTFNYNTYENANGLSFFNEILDELDVAEYLYYAGLLGKSTQNLISTRTEKYDGEDSPYTTNYTYTFNSDDTVRTMSEGKYTISTFTYAD